MKTVVVSGLGLMTALVAARVETPHGEPMITVWVREAGSDRAVQHPMVCIREFNQPTGAIGDSTGKVVFGGNLPRGRLHLRVIAPDHQPLDTIAAWPPPATGSEIRVFLKRQPGSWKDPRCL